MMIILIFFVIFFAFFFEHRQSLPKFVAIEVLQTTYLLIY